MSSEKTTQKSRFTEEETRPFQKELTRHDYVSYPNMYTFFLVPIIILSIRTKSFRFWRCAFCSKFQHAVTSGHFEPCTSSKCRNDRKGDRTSVFERQGPWNTSWSFSHERVFTRTGTYDIVCASEKARTRCSRRWAFIVVAVGIHRRSLGTRGGGRSSSRRWALIDDC